MTPPRLPLGSVIAINLKLLLAVGLAFASYWCWPTNPKWWGFGFISICLGIAALDQCVDALKLMGKLFNRVRTMQALTEGRAEPKSATLASNDALKQAGLIDE